MNAFYISMHSFYLGLGLGVLAGIGIVRLWDWLWDLFCPRALVEYRTTDGGHLCPHPGMTDENLEDFERDMEVPIRTFPCCEPCCKEKVQVSHE